MKKRIMAAILAATLLIGLTACGSTTDETTTASDPTAESADKQDKESTNNQSTDNQSSDNQSSDNQSTEKQSTDKDSTITDIENAAVAKDSGKSLVVYYSATGNTENVATTIAEAANADLFELEPEEPYSDDDLDWRNDDSRVSREHDNPDSREIKLTAATVDNWESYETVFIGYPIWWGIAAWPVNGFVKANDFTGKTVVPFCTATSSGIGESGELLQEMAGSGNWLEGDRFRSGTSSDDIQSWLGDLGL
ncbi:flavodoxin [Robinsoniella sp. KNHs210]|uniref:flavodoxin n=1 Tax=Robinsoniella sp. KNHs210 TaxID=1469950 RepID=UPI0004894942|nr:flavodoxin [Robinsoniella sp. KNHs210]